MLKIGEYTRINGKIGKVKDIVLNGNNYEDSGIYLENEKFILGKEEIYKLKSSYNIIDLIEVGDYVNGYLVRFVYRPNGDETFRIEIEKDGLKGHIISNSNNIKTILTKEQYKNNCYKVEDI